MAAPVGPYSPAVRAGAWLVCSGQVGVAQGPDGPVLAEGFEAQARQAIANVSDVLGAHGVSWRHVVKTTVFLTDIGRFPVFNEIYMDALGTHRPARSLVAVAALPLGAEVEIEAWAYTEA